MKLTIVLTTLMLLAVSSAKATADNGGDPFLVAPDQATVPSSAQQVFVSVATVDTPAARRRPHASLIVYAPDGTMLKRHRRLLRNSTAKFRLLLGTAPQVGTYTAFATVEVDAEAFGMPTTFNVVAD